MSDGSHRGGYYTPAQNPHHGSVDDSVASQETISKSHLSDVSRFDFGWLKHGSYSVRLIGPKRILQACHSVPADFQIYRPQVWSEARYPHTIEVIELRSVGSIRR